METKGYRDINSRLDDTTPFAEKLKNDPRYYYTNGQYQPPRTSAPGYPTAVVNSYPMQQQIIYDQCLPVIVDFDPKTQTIDIPGISGMAILDPNYFALGKIVYVKLNKDVEEKIPNIEGHVSLEQRGFPDEFIGTIVNTQYWFFELQVIGPTKINYAQITLMDILNKKVEVIPAKISFDKREIQPEKDNGSTYG